MSPSEMDLDKKNGRNFRFLIGKFNAIRFWIVCGFRDLVKNFVITGYFRVKVVKYVLAKPFNGMFSMQVGR